ATFPLTRSDPANRGARGRTTAASLLKSAAGWKADPLSINLTELAKVVDPKAELMAAMPTVCPSARHLNELVIPQDEDHEELLKHRFLSRGGGLLFAGPTGVGKSSMAMQLMISWALGREAFGIKSARPLKSMLVQAENDDG